MRAVEAARARPAIDAARVAVTGGSQGGGIALAVAGLAPDLVGGMPDVPFLCDYRARPDITEAHPYREIAQLPEGRTATRMGAVSERWPTSMASTSPRAPTRRRYSRPPCMDEICPPSTVFAAFNHYAGAEADRGLPLQRPRGRRGLPAARPGRLPRSRARRRTRGAERSVTMSAGLSRDRCGPVWDEGAGSSVAASAPTSSSAESARTPRSCRSSPPSRVRRSRRRARRRTSSAGISGLTDQDADAAALLSLLAGTGIRSTVLAHDSTTSYLGALGDTRGAVVASGTGVVTLAVGVETVARVDGWGYIMGDAGSGYWIGRAGARRRDARRRRPRAADGN